MKQDILKMYTMWHDHSTSFSLPEGAQQNSGPKLSLLGKDLPIQSDAAPGAESPQWDGGNSCFPATAEVYLSVCQIPMQLSLFLLLFFPPA